MNTNFSFKLSQLKLISGNEADDINQAEDATNQMLAFVKSQAGIVEEFVDLTQEMSVDAEKTLHNCLTAINHIYIELNVLNNLFSDTDVEFTFSHALYSARKIKETTEYHVSDLLDHINSHD